MFRSVTGLLYCSDRTMNSSLRTHIWRVSELIISPGYSGDVTIVFSQRYLSRFQAIAGGVVEKSIERTLQKSAMMFLETGPTIVLVYHELGVRNAKWTSLQPAEIDPKLLKGRVARRVSHRMNRDHLAVLESVQMEVDS